MSFFRGEKWLFIRNDVNRHIQCGKAFYSKNLSFLLNCSNIS